MKAADFIGPKVKFDATTDTLWSKREDGKFQLLAHLSGKGGIDEIFRDEAGKVDVSSAVSLFTDMGHWITDAINEKLEREKPESDEQ